MQVKRLASSNQFEICYVDGTGFYLRALIYTLRRGLVIPDSIRYRTYMIITYNL